LGLARALARGIRAGGAGSISRVWLPVGAQPGEVARPGVGDSGRGGGQAEWLQGPN
jgi:hypothetical protein